MLITFVVAKYQFSRFELEYHVPELTVQVYCILVQGLSVLWSPSCLHQMMREGQGRCKAKKEKIINQNVVLSLSFTPLISSAWWKQYYSQSWKNNIIIPKIQLQCRLQAQSSLPGWISCEWINCLRKKTWVSKSNVWYTVIHHPLIIIIIIFSEGRIRKVK